MCSDWVCQSWHPSFHCLHGYRLWTRNLAWTLTRWMCLPYPSLWPVSSSLRLNTPSLFVFGNFSEMLNGWVVSFCLTRQANSVREREVNYLDLAEHVLKMPRVVLVSHEPIIAIQCLFCCWIRRGPMKRTGCILHILLYSYAHVNLKKHEHEGVQN